MTAGSSEGAGAPGEAAADMRTATGLSPRAAAVLAYSAWWLTGGLFLLLEPTHPFVRFHARQALLGLGGVWLLGLVLWGLGFVAVFVSSAAFLAFAVLAQVTWASGVVLWLVCLVQAGRGRMGWGNKGSGVFSR